MCNSIAETVRGSFISSKIMRFRFRQNGWISVRVPVFIEEHKLYIKEDNMKITNVSSRGTQSMVDLRNWLIQHKSA